MVWVFYRVCAVLGLRRAGNASHHWEQKARGGYGCCFDCFNAVLEPRVSARSGSGPGTSENAVGVTQSYVWLPPDYWDVDNRQTQSTHCVLLYFEMKQLGEAEVWNIKTFCYKKTLRFLCPIWVNVYVYIYSSKWTHHSSSENIDVLICADISDR